MFPSGAIDNFFESMMRDSKTFGHGSEILFPGIQPANLQNLPLRDLGTVVRTASWPIWKNRPGMLLAARLTALCVSVIRIVFSSAEKEMCRIAAGGRIATMAGAHAVWNWATLEQPSGSVGQGVIGAQCSHSVALILNGAFPKPTGIRTPGFVHSIPEFLRGICGSWHRDVILSHGGAEVNPQSA